MSAKYAFEIEIICRLLFACMRTDFTYSWVTLRDRGRDVYVSECVFSCFCVSPFFLANDFRKIFYKYGKYIGILRACIVVWIWHNCDWYGLYELAYVAHVHMNISVYERTAAVINGNGNHEKKVASSFLCWLLYLKKCLCTVHVLHVYIMAV